MRGKYFKIVLFAVILIFLTLANSACNRRSEPVEDGRITFGISMATFTSPYASATVKQFKQYAEENCI